MPGEFYDYLCVFSFGIAHVKALGWLKKEDEDDETGFSPLLGLSLKQRF